MQPGFAATFGRLSRSAAGGRWPAIVAIAAASAHAALPDVPPPVTVPEGSTAVLLASGALFLLGPQVLRRLGGRAQSEGRERSEVELEIGGAPPTGKRGATRGDG